jgi:hypothetical protein
MRLTLISHLITVNDNVVLLGIKHLVWMSETCAAEAITRHCQRLRTTVLTISLVMVDSGYTTPTNAGCDDCTLPRYYLHRYR